MSLFLKTTMSRLSCRTTLGVLISVSNLVQGVMQKYDIETAKEYMWIEISVTGNFNSVRVYLRANLTAQRPITKLARVIKIIKRTKHKI
jgi:putative lipoic acid-binding regulatory protein